MSDEIKNNVYQFCFTGFTATEKEKLKSLAEQKGHIPRTSVTKNLTHLVVGPKPGLVKKQKAANLGAEIIDLKSFYDLVG